MKTITIRTGSIHVPFHENAQISRDNILAGRPFDEGWLPNQHVPDPRGLPEWVTLQFPSEGV